MSHAIEIQALSERNFDDYVALTGCGRDGGCFCSFWHQRWASSDDWKARQRDAPDLNRECVRERLRSGFHVGVLAYRDGALLGWVAVAPLPEVYWCWRRVAQLGLDAERVAGILCMTLSPDARGEGMQSQVLSALADYGRSRTWKTLEGYPFDPSAIQLHGDELAWPGYTEGFRAAGFERSDSHWLSRSGHERSVYRLDLAPAVTAGG